MTRSTLAALGGRRFAPDMPGWSALAAAALALAGCTTLGNPPAANPDSTLYAPAQSNLTSLSEVIEKHPDDPQAYNMRGTVYGQAGRNEQALADFNKAIGLDPNYAQAYANRALIYRKTVEARPGARRRQQGAGDRRVLRARLSRPRHRLPRARTRRPGARRFQQGDRAEARQRRRLLQSRPALSEPAAASVRHRRFLDRDRSRPTTAPSPTWRAH